MPIHAASSTALVKPLAVDVLIDASIDALIDVMPDCSKRIPCNASYASYSSYVKGQQGVALLTVLLIVVAITVVAGAMLASQKMHLRQYELLLNQDKILHSVKAGELLAVALITADSTVNDSDSMQDAWAQTLAPLPFSDYDISLSIKDVSGRFNLNNLYHDGEADTNAIAVFERLLSELDLEPSLAYTVLDWQDPDNITSAEGGAEAAEYASGAKGMRVQVANQPFISSDELLSVRGFTPDIVNALQPHVTAVPYYVPINVNTASPMVLSALLSGIDTGAINGFSEQGQAQPITEIDALFSQEPWSLLEDEEQGLLKPMLATTSSAFTVLIDVATASNATNNAVPADSATSVIRHRYATTMISKVTADNSQEDNSKNPNANIKPINSNVQSTNNNVQNNIQPDIRAFSTRLWAYRPRF